MDSQLHPVFLTGIAVLASCLALHSFFIYLVVESEIAFRNRFPGATGIWLVVPSLLIAAVLLVLSSFLQIGIWSVVHWRFGHFTLLQDVVYFSGTTFTTLGTGKHTLESPYCMLEPMEATNGILVAGLNTAILYAILSRVARAHRRYRDFLG